MYSAGYIFLKGSPRCSYPLQLHKPVHLGQNTVPKNLLCHVSINLPSFRSCRSFFENDHLLAIIAHFRKLFISAVERITPSKVLAIAVDQLLIPFAKQTHWTLVKCIIKINMP